MADGGRPAAAGGGGALPKAPKGLKCVGAGKGGIEQMCDLLDDEKVQFGLLKLKIGSGTFARTKLVFIHMNGERCGAVKKGKINTKKDKVKGACGATHAELQIETAEEATVDSILGRLSGVMKVDDMGKFSIAQMKADYEAMLATAADGEDRPVIDLAKGTGRKTAKELGSIEGQRALDEVKKDNGTFNWVLFDVTKGDNKLHLHNAGSLSVMEMEKWLAEDKVLSGLLRMGFGSGRFKRTKYIALQWSGEKVSAVKRGRANMAASRLEDTLRPFSVSIKATEADECSLAQVIDRVRRSAVVDGDDAEGGASAFSVEKFMEALQEETKATADFFGDNEPRPAAGGTTMKVGDAIDALRSSRRKTNWALFEFK